LPEYGIPVTLTSADKFTGIDDPNFSGKVQPAYLHITSALIEDEDLKLQIECIPDETDASTIIRVNSNGKRSSHAPVLSVRCNLSVTMYGPMDLFDHIGEFFESYDIFIQDPRNCNRVVRYCNPHRLSALLEDHPWTSDLGVNANLVELKDIAAGPELLDLLDSQSGLAEMPQPWAIATNLERYSKTQASRLHN
jgi:SWI/SNF-related matrix-associated actin-dependent regulator of chromatin subfamily A3